MIKGHLYRMNIPKMVLKNSQRNKKLSPFNSKSILGAYSFKRYKSWSFRRFNKFCQEAKDSPSRLAKIDMVKEQIFSKEDDTTLDEKIEILKLLTAQQDPPYKAEPLNLSSNIVNGVFSYKNVAGLRRVENPLVPDTKDVLDLLFEIIACKGLGSDTLKKETIELFMKKFELTDLERRLLKNILSVKPHISKSR